MKLQQRVKRGTILFCVMIAIGLLGGCAKQRAQLALKKAQKLVRQAETHEAVVYVPDKLEQSRQLIDDAEKNMSARQYKRALERAKSAVKVSKDTLEQAKINRAADLVNKAQQDRRIADINYGRQEDPERYDRILELLRKAEEARNKNKWEAAIERSLEVTREVGILLQRKRLEAQSKLQEAKNMERSMRTVGAMEKAPEFVIEVNDLIKQAEKQFEEERNYVGAIQVAERARSRAEEGIVETKARLAMDDIREIEQNLALAIEIGAKFFALDLYNDAAEAHDRLLDDYFSKKYDRVLEAAKILKPQVEDLVKITRRRSAEARIKAVRNTISKLVEGGAKEYLPGRVEVLEEALEKAEGEFAVEAYEEAEKTCALALEEADKITEDFQELALDAMRSARESLDIASGVFAKMGEIFIPKPREIMTALELEFEQAKTSLQEELAGTLRNSQLSLELAKQNQERGDFKRSIELSALVKRSAEYVLTETYHVVAHNAVMELASAVTHHEKDGGREYAPREMDRTKVLLEDARALIRESQYKEAVAKAAETRAQLEIAVQEIEEKAIAFMDEAREGLAEADKTQTQKYRLKEWEETQQLLKEATERLDREELKPAVEKAMAAAETIAQANLDALQLWASDEINAAEAKLMAAADAGADTYAAEEYNDGEQLLRKARQLLDREQFEGAKDAALKAKETAGQALYRKVLRAEDMVEQARYFGAWEYASVQLASAAVQIKEAHKAMGENKYHLANMEADSALDQAEKLLRSAQDRSFKQRVQELKEQLDFALEQGMSHFQVAEIKELIKELARIDASYKREQVEEYLKQLNELEAKAGKLLAELPGTVEGLMAKYEERLGTIEEAFGGAVPLRIKEAKRYLHYARLDFSKQKMVECYRNLRSAGKMIYELNEQLKGKEYREQVQELLNEWTTALGEFDNVLRLGEAKLVNLGVGPEGKGRMLAVCGAMKPTEFNDRIEALYHDALELKPPEGLRGEHRELVLALNEGRLSSLSFQNMLLFDQFTREQIKATLHDAFVNLESAKQRIATLQQEAQEREKMFRESEVSFAP